MTYDNACKYLAEQYPRDFVRWLLSIETQSIQVLKTELTLEPIRADSVSFLQTANQILHVEFQTLPDSTPSIPFRMLALLNRSMNCHSERKEVKRRISVDASFRFATFSMTQFIL